MDGNPTCQHNVSVYVRCYTCHPLPSAEHPSAVIPPRPAPVPVEDYLEERKADHFWLVNNHPDLMIFLDNWKRAPCGAESASAWNQLEEYLVRNLR